MTTTEDVRVYWRPGCGFCSRLRRQLDQAGIPYTAVDIWADDEAAAFVRSVARGNETVPTVAVGPVALVNPSLDEVLDAMEEHTPDLVPDPRPERSGIRRWLG